MALHASMIEFRRLTMEDLPLLYHWSTTDPVVRHVWCHDRVESYESVASHYAEYITGAKPTDPYLICYGEVPIGYIQTYLWRDYPDYGQYIDLSDAASFDVYIGEAAYRNRGLGPGMLARFLSDYMFANPEVLSCVITPEVSNRSAIRAYEKVGFRHVCTVAAIPDEPGPVYFMRIEQHAVLGKEAKMQPLTPEQYPSIAQIITGKPPEYDRKATGRPQDDHRRPQDDHRRPQDDHRKATG